MLTEGEESLLVCERTISKICKSGSQNCQCGAVNFNGTALEIEVQGLIAIHLGREAVGISLHGVGD